MKDDFQAEPPRFERTASRMLEEDMTSAFGNRELDFLGGVGR